MENLIQELIKFYPNTKFIESTRDGNSVLIYDNEELEWNKEFIDKVLQLAEKYLTSDELEGFTFLYDYLKEIPTTKDIKESNLTCGKKICKTNKEVLQERLKNREIDALDYKNDCTRCWNRF